MDSEEALRHGSLFSGIGGFDLAATWMGWRNVFHCEKDQFCSKILNHYWPEAKAYGDIRKFDATCYRGLIDIVTGGFPCQPFSAAGRRQGTADDRYLWPEMYRIIGEIQPDWVVGENVLGLLNWRRGMAFEQVQIDLEAAGYEVRTFILPAAGVGAPHLRYRIWFVAYARRKFGDGGQGAEGLGFHYGKGAGRTQAADIFGGLCAEKSPADTYSDQRLEGGMHETKSETAAGLFGPRGAWNSRDAWTNFPTQPPVCKRDDGFSAELDGIAFSEWRRRSIAGLGNAIVPQVALQIFRAIEWSNRYY